MDGEAMSTQAALWPVDEPGDPELDVVAQQILAADPHGRRTAGAIRRSIDMLLDGQHTGRFRWDQLYKTEKAHLGTLIEINMQREFGFADGLSMDYSIAGTDVDCKYSQTLGGWMVPPEALGHLLLVVWASDEESRWSAGLVRALPERLNNGGNRDAKKTLNAAGRAAVRWLFHRAPLQENMLLRLSEADIKAIFSHRSGQRRVDDLFVRAQGRRISRTVVATVAMQEDYMKRVRYNGGSRSRLQPRGIVILGHYSSHGRIAEALGLPVPGPGESVSARLAAAGLRHGDAPRVELGGQEWVVARPDDPEEAVPKLPEI
ncbi:MULTISPECIES: NaeI family type II restriction endonuclease [unclassified Streptomyces]|uniref:NaeI family type II restriction endonuclease n=1 Tax=unclassified Streptomyces TaxID=2593676 RepID=UPI000F45D01B|nr:NaeI family type II restriction endonuclease [Streptomyces sp. I6]RNL72092.1 restriction endonuclease [Streptomyces sp. I6]